MLNYLTAFLCPELQQRSTDANMQRGPGDKVLGAGTLEQVACTQAGLRGVQENRLAGACHASVHK